jgi:hypothetical protein
VRYELGHRQADRVAAELESGPLGQLLFPLDALLVPLCFERVDPVVAVDVEHLVEREVVAVLKESPVVGRKRVVDAAAEEHRSAGHRLLALDVAPAPRLRAAHPQTIGRRR